MRPTGPLLLMTSLQGQAGGVYVVLAALAWIEGPGFYLSTTRAVLAAVGLALVAGGGLGSIFHMHRLAGARFVLRRLKSSWLSREVVTTMAFAAAAALSVALPWLAPTSKSALPAVLTVTAALGLGAMFVTAMIYTTIPAMLSWHTPLTAVVMMGTGLVAGSVWAWAAMVLVAGAAPADLGRSVLVALLVLGGLKASQWRRFARVRSQVAAGQRLGPPGVSYRLHDAGTSRAPYRTQPQVWAPLSPGRARRAQTLVAGLAVITGAVLLVGGAGPWAVLAVFSSGAAVYWERWLFFADATHSSLAWIAMDLGAPLAGQA